MKPIYYYAIVIVLSMISSPIFPQSKELPVRAYPASVTEQEQKNPRLSITSGCGLVNMHALSLNVGNLFFDVFLANQYGFIGFQFPQVEIHRDMAACVKRVEPIGIQTGAVLDDETITLNPMQRMIMKTLALTDSEAMAFFSVYKRFEADLANLQANNDQQQYDHLLGDASLAQNDGNPEEPLIDAVSSLDPENILKLRYFNEMEQLAGAYLASRFLAWVDYYSITCKL